MTEYNHFLDLDIIDSSALRSILENAKRIKADLKKGIFEKPLADKQLAMIFEKASTRTRVSFEVGMNQLGGNALMLSSNDSQIGRGEPVIDTAGVLSRMVDIIMIRTYKHETLLELADKSSIPVINALTDYSHPCQIMADIMTIEEHLGEEIKGKTVAWTGDYNNVAISWSQAAEQFGFHLRIACPAALSEPGERSKYVTVTENAVEAVTDADVVTTDTWVSMGDENADYKLELLKDFQVNDELMRSAKDNALFLHCLPAHRGEEVTDSVIDGPQSVIYDEAENRLHVQKAIMLWCLGV